MVGQFFRRHLYGILPKPRAGGRAGFDPTRIRRIVAFRKGPNPTFTYYLEERLKRISVPVEFIDLQASTAPLDPVGSYVILCRYALPRQIWWLLKHRRQLAGLALMIDDDIAATVTEGQGKFGYRLYLLGIAIAPLLILNRFFTHIWPATGMLADRFGIPDVVAPLPPPETWRVPTPKTSRTAFKMIYHATGAHDLEHRFLVPIVARVLEQCPDVRFEVVASGNSARLWKDLDNLGNRLELIPESRWPDYLRRTAEEGADLVLVPLLPGRVNDVRSDTKRVDVARMGAAAVFSRSLAYERCTVPEEILVDDDPERWVERIVRLLKDETERQVSAEAVQASVVRMMERASPFLPGLEQCMQALDERVGRV
ncbi:hypothetical protein ACQKGC_23585 [Allorhizobium pseudoryzae]|uniref:hypothetical protein n=1 Tax=Allorhizobium pseudoryzae TaxID=379684 RepID=UPI003CFE0059